MWGYQLIILAFSTGLANANFEEEYLVTLQRVWDAFEKTEDGYVGEQQIIEFFYRYNDYEQPSYLDIREEEFCGGNVSFISDFGATSESCIAYFKLFDLSRFTEFGDIFERITEEDVAVIFLVADTDLDGWINETDWTQEMRYALRPLPFAAMFVRYRAALGTGWYDDYISLATWLDIWAEFANEEDPTTASSQGVVNFWVNGGFGSEVSGNLLFFNWDINGDGVLTLEEFSQIYEVCVVWDGVVYYDQFVFFHDRAMHPLDPFPLRDSKQ